MATEVAFLSALDLAPALRSPGPLALLSLAPTLAQQLPGPQFSAAEIKACVMSGALGKWSKLETIPKKGGLIKCPKRILATI